MRLRIPILLALTAWGCRTSSPQGTAPSEAKQALDFIPAERIVGRAVLEPKSGGSMRGIAVLSEVPTGLRLTAKITNATPGFHGIHIHEKGDCSASDASSAGGHWNPTQSVHGHLSLGKAHAGDLGNILVDRDNEGLLSIVIPLDTSKGIDNVSSFIGKALVVHAGEDDLSTDPAGNSGDRMSCGVFTAK